MKRPACRRRAWTEAQEPWDSERIDRRRRAAPMKAAGEPFLWISQRAIPPQFFYFVFRSSFWPLRFRLGQRALRGAAGNGEIVAAANQRVHHLLSVVHSPGELLRLSVGLRLLVLRR